MGGSQFCTLPRLLLGLCGDLPGVVCAFCGTRIGAGKSFDIFCCELLRVAKSFRLKMLV